MKKAIVMGATSGIGLAIVRQLCDRGWQVGIAGRRQTLLEEIAHNHANVIALRQIDVTREDAPHELLSLIEDMGGMDLYFHSSGIGFQNPQLDADKELNTVMTNTLGFTRMVITAFRYYEEHPEREGQIAVISSIAGTRALGAAPAYSASKRYINHYLECLTQLKHIKHMVRLSITDIRPGFVRTPLLSDGGKYPLQLNVDDAAREILKGVLKKKSIVTVDYRYRILVFFWRLIPRWLWIRLPIVSK